MYPAGGGNRLGTEILVGIGLAVIATSLFIDVPTDWKIIMVVALAFLAALNFLTMVGWKDKAILRVREWSRNRKIRRHPDMVEELYRLGFSIYKVLFERSSEHASLIAQGEEAIRSLYADGEEGWLLGEFSEKVKILKDVYNPIHEQLKNCRWSNYRWKTYEFGEILRNINIHLNNLSYVFETVYRQAKMWPKEKPFKESAVNAWETFRTECNATIQDWNTFTGRFESTFSYGIGAQPKLAKPLPVS